ncbi:Sister chromatid cohesion protein 2 [Tulasnella sp. 424]|nr:Sister chromatid cohesion protein 2 [Tulasnella sp. 424]KAG8980522.1 Sister chromatid cohesion protein 2 [Tulasnella sp. 425]
MSGWNDPYNQSAYRQGGYHQSGPPQPQTPVHHAQPSSNPASHASNPAISTVSGAESIMGMYPLASITPVTHVARHLAVPAPPVPSFVRSYTLNGAMDMPPQRPNSGGYADHPPPYAELPPITGVASLATNVLPPLETHQRQYWDQQRDRTERLLAQQRSESPSRYNSNNYTQQQPVPAPYPVYNPSPQVHQNQQYAPPPPSRVYAPPQTWGQSSYQSTPFASSILNSAPYASSSTYYSSNTITNARAPSTSSLSNALGDQHPRPRHVEQPRHFQEQRSHGYPPQQVQHHQQPSHQWQEPIPRQQTGQQPSYAQNQYAQQLPPIGPPAVPRPETRPQPAPVSNYSRPQYTSDQSSEFFDNFLADTIRAREAEEAAARARKQEKRPVPAAHAEAQRVIKPLRPSASSSSLSAAPLSSPAVSTAQQGPADIHQRPRPKTPPKRPAPVPRIKPPNESPDPLALPVSHPGPAPAVTPQKRKYDEPLQSPTIKRLQSMEGVRPKKVSLKPSSSGSVSSASSMSISSTPRKMLEVYVEVPPPPKGYTPTAEIKARHKQSTSANSTPFNSQSTHRARMGSVLSDVTKTEAESDDELALGSAIKPYRGSAMKSGGIRTGDRDDRGPIEKLIELLEDIFEAEDSVDPENLSADQLGHFFSRLTLDFNQPLLNTAIIAKLTKAISQVSRPTKRVRLMVRDGNLGTPGVIGLAELEANTLSRMLKLLGRSVKLGEDLDPFAGPPASISVDAPADTAKGKKKSSAKGKAKPDSGGDRARSRSKTPADGGDAGVNEVSEGDMQNLERTLQVAKESALAADGCLALLCADKLPKQLYAEELITSCMTAIKNQFSKIIFPFASAQSDIHGQVSVILWHLITQDDPETRVCRSLVGEIFHSLCAVLPRINSLVTRTDLAMSDSIIIQAVYISLGPFFNIDFGVDPKSSKEKTSFAVIALGGSAALRALRLSSLSLIRSIFAYYPDQRTWIIEEILASLIQIPNLKSKSGQFRLRDGHSIHTISALLLQLVQTSAHDVRVKGRSFAKARLQQASQFGQSNAGDAAEPLLSEKDREEIAMYGSALDSPNVAARSIIVFLTTRTGKGKTTKSTKEADYRAILDNLIQDLLTVLFWPEWPAASILLGVATKYLLSALDDVKTSTAAANDSNGAKSMALDHLGVIGARLRSTQIKFKQQASGLEESLGTLEEIVAKADDAQLERLIAAHEDVATHLAKRSSEDQAYDSARELTASMWGQDLSKALSRCDSILSSMVSEGSEGTEELDQFNVLASRMKMALYDVWKETATDVFDVGTEIEISRLDALAEELGSLQRLSGAHDAILNVTLNCLDAPVVFMRTKGLRALGQIINADPEVLRKANVKQAIENHLHDLSPAVRDAAVELVSKYIAQSSDLAQEYYPVLADRIADTSIAVRKRIIKLLKAMYETAGDDRDKQVDIGARLVSRMSDDDDGVKDLALKTLEDLWLGDLPQTAFSRHSISLSNDDIPSQRWTVEEKAKATAQVIMGVAGFSADRHSPLEDLFHQVVSSKEGKETSAVFARYQEICNALIGSLVDSESLEGFDLVSCVKTVHLLVAAHPPMMSLSNAKSLLPYLKNTATKEDQAIADFILKIYCACIPHLPKTAVQFAQELQSVLATRIQKPSNPLVLPECIACFCAVVKHLTHDYQRVVGLLKSCNGRVKTLGARPDNVNPQALRSLIIIAFMISLLCEHCDFDSLRSEHPDLAPDIDSVSKLPIADHVYEVLLALYEDFRSPAARAPLVRCLGYLFRAQPTLMTRPQSAAMMDAVFEGEDEDAKGRLLKIMQGFLISESEKHSALQKGKNTKKPKAINMEELVGNTDGFAESGVSSAVVQRYLPQILEAALSSQLRIQAVAVDILGFTVKQGLAHPLQCMPVIVALETSASAQLSARAHALHSILSSKHASLVNSRYMECARTSFDYQFRLRKEGIQGYRLDPLPTALLQKWYSLVKEKRPARQDFLKALVKVFELDSTKLSSSQTDIDFVRYMAENFSSLDYKTQEEVLTVIRHLTSVLSTAGMQVYAVWAPQISHEGHPFGQVEGSQSDDVSFARASVIVGMVSILKAYLKSVYGISEDKCAKWVPGKKSALGDKPALRRNPEFAMSWERLPFATTPILVADDIAKQRQHFVALWEADGVQPEPQDLDMD